MKLSILMPVYNERRTLPVIVSKVLSQPVQGIDVFEIIVVDDGSTDGSTAVIQALAASHPDTIKPIFFHQNQGKGAAISAAIKAASGDVAIIQDADLEYDPADYPSLLSPILDGTADVVYGSRFMVRGHRRVLFFRHALGNRLLTFISNIFTDFYLTDMETGYKAFRLHVMKTIPLRSRRFGIEPEITAKVAKRKLRVYEVPIAYRGRTYAEGKKIRWGDGVQALYVILKYWLIDDMFEGDYGHLDLIDLERAPNFTAWALDSVKRYLGETVLEVGAGIGNNVRALMAFSNVIATDRNEDYLRILRNAFENVPYVSVHQWDVTQAPPLTLPVASCIFCSNVLEHIANDQVALQNMRSFLEPDGVLILIVPQGQWLYCSLDIAVDHCRRYDRDGLGHLLESNGYVVDKLFSFNKVGLLGWILRGKLMRNKELGRLNLKLFNVMVPVLRVIDGLLPWQGLSLVAVARKSPSVAAGVGHDHGDLESRALAGETRAGLALGKNS